MEILQRFRVLKGNLAKGLEVDATGSPFGFAGLDSHISAHLFNYSLAYAEAKVCTTVY